MPTFMPINKEFEKIRVYKDDYIQSDERSTCPSCSRKTLAVMANPFLIYKFYACTACGERFTTMIVDN